MVFEDFDEKIIAMCAWGMTVREIQGFLQEQYSNEVSPEFIRSVTDEVIAGATAWQPRPLEPMYPVAFFDDLRVKIREDTVVRNKAAHSRWAFYLTASATFSVCGSKIPRTPSSGWRCLTI